MNWEKIEEKIKDEPTYRIKQLKRLLFKDLIEDWSDATTLSIKLREELKKECPLDIKYNMFESNDGDTSKALIELDDGEKIETVLMRHTDKRTTICVSSQVGCALNCAFCATGMGGLKRNLKAGEIILQLLLFSRYLKKEGKTITNVVFMGMGEPFMNYDEVMKAIRIINDADSFNIGARKISVSTSGIVEGIEKFMNEDLQVNLSISLHAPNEELRSSIMPINKNYSLNSVIKAVDKYIEKTGRKVMFEYLLLEGINDSLENAKELAKLMRKPLYMVNLIIYNPTGKFKPSSREIIKKFKEHLEKQGIFITQRYEFGRGIKAACGQLAGENGIDK
jgi:23S rRNA (adenine2503-C2)-methyltransferase